MIINVAEISVAFIGAIPEPIFANLKNLGVIPNSFSDPQEELNTFKANFFGACKRAKDNANPAEPITIPAWRFASFYELPDKPDNGYYLHPYSSTELFPPPQKKGFLGRITTGAPIVAEECCDVEARPDGTIKTVAVDTNLMAIIFQNASTLAIQLVTSDKKMREKPMLLIAEGQVDPAGKNPLHLDIGEPTQLIPYFQGIRAKGGAQAAHLLRRPAYLSSQAG